MDMDRVIGELLDELDNSLLISQLGSRLRRVATLFAPAMNEEQADDVICTFMIGYIRLAPDLLKTLDQLVAKFKIEPLTSPGRKLATEYLTSACEELSQDKGEDSLRTFLTLLNGAYVFHRMIEELDDSICNFIGIPMTHFDMMNANLIAHDIIGDKFANRLDRMITSLFQQSKVTTALIKAQLDREMIESYKKSGKALSGKSIVCFADQHHLSMLNSGSTTL